MKERIATLPARFLLRASRDPEGAGPPASVRRLRAGFWWVSRVPSVSFTSSAPLRIVLRNQGA